MSTNMHVRAEQNKARTKSFAMRVIRVVRALPKEEEARIIGRQLLRSGTSVGANYRAACRARSTKEFASKIGIVVEESDESGFWLELLIDAKIVSERKLGPLLDEANQLTAMFAASYRTAKRKKTSS